MENWFIVYFKQKRFANGSAWTTYISYGPTEELAIQRIEAERHREGYKDWQRTEDTEAEPVSPEEFKAGLLKVIITH